MRPSTRQKRQKIITVATELFLRQGWEQTGLDQIIESCGGSKQTLYRYFGDKRGLFAAVITHCIEQAKESFCFPLDSTESLKQQLQQFGCSFLDMVLSIHVLRVYRLVLIEAQHDPQWAEYFRKMGPLAFYHQLEQFLTHQMKNGLLRSSDPAIATRQLVALFKGDLQEAALLTGQMPTRQAIEQQVEKAVICFLQGYAVTSNEGEGNEC